MVDSNDRVNFLSEVVWHGGDCNKHLVRSAIGRTFVVILGTLPHTPNVSILDGLFSKNAKGPQVIIDRDTFVLGHPVMTEDDHFQLVETCSGIGCMSDGINAVGITIKAKNDISEPFCSFQERQGFQNMIVGNISDNKTIAEIHAKAPHASWLAAGFSCQPWSRYGDQRKMDDPRASTLHAVLRCAFFLRCHSVILECVQAAGADPAVKQLLQDWCKLTGFRQSPIDLSLQHLWPATRDRWWCILTYGCLPSIALEPFPKFPRLPIVGDLLPHFLQLSNDECQDLRLDLYETNKYIECGGLEKNLASLDCCLPTALHGWANQLTSCPCQCRAQPLSYSRLLEKGLHGVLIPMEGCIESAIGQIPQLRHIHPWELALCSGVEPNRHWYPHRLALAGLGQLASPIQCLWVLAQWKWHLSEGFGNQHNQFPEQVLWEYMTKLFTIRDELFMCSALTPRQRLFIKDLHAVLGGHAQAKLTVGSLQINHDYGLNLTNGIPGIFEKFNPEDSVSPPEIASTEETIENGGPEEHSQVVIHNVELPSIHDLDAIQASKKGKGGTIPKRHFETPEYGHEQPGNLSTGDPVKASSGLDDSRIDRFDRKGVKRARNDAQDALPHFSASGGVPGFSTKQIDEPCHLPTEDIKPQDEPKCVGPFDISDHDGLTQEFHQKAIEYEIDNAGSVVVRVYTPDSSTPAFVKVQPHDTIGSIAVAEHKLNTTELPLTSIRVESNLGLPIPSSQTPSSMQSLFLADIGSKHAQHCPCGTEETCKPTPCYPATRLSVLYHQGPWVAADEIRFYFSLIENKGLGTSLPPIILRSTIPSELELQAIVDLITSLPSDPCKGFFTALLIKNHWVPVVIVPNSEGFEIHSAEEGINILKHALNQQNSVNIALMKAVVPSLFPADCGFQTLGCIIGLLGSPKCFGSADELTPSNESHWFSQQTAEGWRVLFEHHLLCTGLGSTVLCQEIDMGGAGKDDIYHQLSQLLHEHGVPGDQIESRTNIVIDKLGRTSIAKAFRASRPWAEIKSLANNVVPKVQLVLPSELQEVISARLQDSTPFGDKRQKKPKTVD